MRAERSECGHRPDGQLAAHTHTHTRIYTRTRCARYLTIAILLTHFSKKQFSERSERKGWYKMEYNCRVYDYEAGQHVSIYRRTITRKDGDELADDNKNANFTKAYQNENRTEEEEEHSRKVSLASTKNRLYNIARSNAWEWFITLTFDRETTDASDYEAVTKRLQKFLNNLQQRTCPELKYLIVPEFHADGTNYHFHGLLADCDGLRFRYSGHDTEYGYPIYNILNWKYGFTTATRVTDTRCVSSYITKYITKESQVFLKEKNRYYCSRNINRVQPDFHIVDEEDFLKVYGDRITYAKSEKITVALQQINYYELDY